jgi:hypothetical protein
MENLIKFLEEEKYDFELLDDCKAIQIQGFNRRVYIEPVGTQFDAHTEKYNDYSFMPYNEKTLKSLKGVKGYIERYAC